MSIINRKISIKCQIPKHLTKFYLLSLLPESESAKLVVMVMTCPSWSSWSSGQKRKPGNPEQTDLTFKLDFLGNLWRASFANFAMFYTRFGMDHSLKLGRERAAQKLIVCRHNRG